MFWVFYGSFLCEKFEWERQRVFMPSRWILDFQNSLIINITLRSSDHTHKNTHLTHTNSCTQREFCDRRLSIMHINRSLYSYNFRSIDWVNRHSHTDGSDRLTHGDRHTVTQANSHWHTSTHTHTHTHRLTHRHTVTHIDKHHHHHHVVGRNEQIYNSALAWGVLHQRVHWDCLSTLRFGVSNILEQYWGSRYGVALW